MRLAWFACPLHGDAVDAQSVRLGAASIGLSTPDRSVLLREEDYRVLRIDIYFHSGDGHCFEAAIVWMDFVAIGIGKRLYLVHASTRQVIEHHLGSYLGYPYHSAMYATSAERVFSIGQDGRRLLTSETLGIDGVGIHEINRALMNGEGEWDPPGGWSPFLISVSTGSFVGD